MMVSLVIGGIIYTYITIKSRTDNRFVNVSIFFLLMPLLANIFNDPIQSSITHHGYKILMLTLIINVLHGIVVMYYDIYICKYLRFDAPLSIYRALLILTIFKYPIVFRFASILFKEHPKTSRDTIDVLL